MNQEFTRIDGVETPKEEVLSCFTTTTATQH